MPILPLYAGFKMSCGVLSPPGTALVFQPRANTAALVRKKRSLMTLLSGS